MKPLSNRQMQVQLTLLADMTVEQSAVELGITISTVRVHMTGIRQRYGIIKRGSAPIAIAEAKLAIQLPRRRDRIEEANAPTAMLSVSFPVPYQRRLPS